MSRKEKTEELLRKHEPLFKILKINDPLYILKNAYFISGKKGRFIQLFESEVSKEKERESLNEKEEAKRTLGLQMVGDGFNKGMLRKNKYKK